MAIRNLNRNRRRTMLTMASLAISLLLITFLDGFLKGVVDSMVVNSTRAASGHVRIVGGKGNDARLDGFSAFDIRTDAQQVRKLLAEQSDVSAHFVKVLPRFEGTMRIDAGTASRNISVLAGDPALEADFIVPASAILEGAWPSARGEIAVGDRLAASMGLTKGAEVTLSAVLKGGTALQITGVVRAVFRSSQGNLDDGWAFLPIADMQAALGYGDDAQQFSIFLADYHEANALTAALSGDQPNLSARSWTTIGFYSTMVALLEGVYFWVYLFVALLGAVVVTNVMTMMSLERRREIGMLKALGFSRRDVLALFLLEGGFIGGIGSVVGVFFGYVINIVLARVGVDFTSALGGLSIPVSNVIHPRVDLLQAPLLLAIGIGVTLLLSYLPALRAARFPATRALRDAA